MHRQRHSAIISIAMPLGLYISIPFCQTKCSYCNFASGVFSRTLYSQYVDRLMQELQCAPQNAERMGGRFDREVDSIYLGGGTPTILPPEQLERLFTAVRENFEVKAGAEITVECAPGTLDPPTLETLQRCGVNRVSLGVQSMVDAEAAAVGRRHTRAVVLDDIERLRSAGIANVNVDLIAGLPHQTAQSWEVSLSETLASGVPHLSVYMLEIDEDSRLGRELIAGGTRYHAHFVPDEDATADFYVEACRRLEAAGVPQYEISNFASKGAESRHNLKYWTRQPYLGFGVDAHSMLHAANGQFEAVRFSAPDSLEGFLSGAPLNRMPVSRQSAREETFFLGLRLNQGVDLDEVALRFGLDPDLKEIIAELCADKLIERFDNRIRLTERGRLMSNEVFERFLAESEMPVRDCGA
jgi:oxygen-independent coproporphyrinogen-3 oxidase